MIKGLKDIKGIVEVSDDSLLTFGIVVSVVLLVVIVTILWFMRKKRVKRRFLLTDKECARERIEAIDYDDPKSVVYAFGEDVKLFVDEKNRQKYQDILQGLQKYKYQKEVPPLDTEQKERIKRFIKEIKWVI